MILVFNVSCNEQDKELLKKIEVEILDKSLNKPRTGIEVRVFKIKKPIFSMWQFHELDRVITDSLGVCSFQVNKKGQYSLRFYEGKNLLYSTDDIEINDLNNNKFVVEW
jgi:5-hydroxyisourate hydrolase-like protein (transthyretin family)